MDSKYALLAQSDARASGDYLTITARFVEIADDGTPRNLRLSRFDAEPYAGIVASGQASRNDWADDPKPLDYSYGWSVGFETDTGETADAETLTLAARTLGRISKRMTADDSAYGAPGTFGAYVARVATAAGVPVMIGRSGDDGFYSSGQWQLWRPGECAPIIDGWVCAFRRKDGGS